MEKAAKKRPEIKNETYAADSGTNIREVKPKKKKKKKHILLYLAIVGFVFYAMITIINQNVQISEKKAELKELQQEINVVEIQSQYLSKVQNYSGEELSEYVEKIAKDDLGYISEGERIFINVTSD